MVANQSKKPEDAIIPADSLPQGTSDAPAPVRGITRRAIIIGIVVSLVHTVWVVYEEQSLGHLPFAFTAYLLLPSALGVLLTMMALNSLFLKYSPRRVFSPIEMLTVFSMMTVSAIIAGADLMALLFPTIVAPYTSDDSSPEAVAEAARLWQNTPHWIFPHDRKVIYLYQHGTSQFWGFFRPEIFKAWILPIGFWATFLVLLGGTMLCLNAVLRRQWVNHERLSFPIVEIPLFMARQNNIRAMFSSKPLLITFACTSAILSMNCLSFWFPSIPTLNLNVMDAAQYFTTPPWSGMSPISVSWWPLAIGLCYFVPQDVAFSSWFFYVLIRLAMAFGTSLGWREPGAGFEPSQFPFIQLLAQGAWVGVFMVVMWSTRPYFLQILKSIFTRKDNELSEGEPMRYRTAAVGALVGFLLIAGMLVASGARPHIVMFFIGIYLLVSVVMTRIYAEMTLPAFELSFLSSISLATNLTGSNALNSQDALVLSNLHWLDRTYRQQPMGHEMESMVMAGKQGQGIRAMPKLIFVALVIGSVVGMITMLQISYNGGTSGVLMWIMRVETWNRYHTWVTEPKGVDGPTILKIGSSALLVILLSIARRTWLGWPFHPIGYALACSYSMEYFWNVILVTWLIKSLVLRYGGLKLYRKSLPIAFGLVLGDAITQMAWALAFTATGARGGLPYGAPGW